MTIFRDIFKLSKKLSKALLENKGLQDLETSDLFLDDAKTHIKQHLSNEAIKENLELLNQIDKEADWKNVAEGISGYGKVKPKKHFSISSFYKIAAAILIFISIGYLTINNSIENEDLDTSTTEILAGTDKAILTLDDGSAIVLDEKKQYKNAMVIPKPIPRLNALLIISQFLEEGNIKLPYLMAL